MASLGADRAALIEVPGEPSSRLSGSGRQAQIADLGVTSVARPRGRQRTRPSVDREGTHLAATPRTGSYDYEAALCCVGFPVRIETNPHVRGLTGPETNRV